MVDILNKVNHVIYFLVEIKCLLRKKGITIALTPTFLCLLRETRVLVK